MNTDGISAALHSRRGWPASGRLKAWRQVVFLCVLSMYCHPPQGEGEDNLKNDRLLRNVKLWQAFYAVPA